MADNGTSEPSDAGAEFPADSGEWASLADGQTRRKFLRNALIVSAAGTAVVGTATALMVKGAGATPRLTTPSGTSTPTVSPPPLESDPCVTYTQVPLAPASCFGGGTDTQGEFWLFFTIYDVPVGSYTADLEQSTDGGVTTTPITGGSSPFEFQNDKSVHVSVGGTPAKCPTAVAGDAQADSAPVPVSVTGTMQDVQVAAHIGYNGTPVDGTYTFIFTLLHGATVEAQATTSVVHPCPSIP